MFCRVYWRRFRACPWRTFPGACWVAGGRSVGTFACSTTWSVGEARGGKRQRVMDGLGLLQRDVGTGDARVGYVSKCSHLADCVYIGRLGKPSSHSKHRGINSLMVRFIIHSVPFLGKLFLSAKCQLNARHISHLCYSWPKGGTCAKPMHLLVSGIPAFPTKTLR